ncbi:sensor histidine kinase [Vagococcus carniphilus]|uniref:sensor histidine kinase n=1 Tax=Vagococcus carniphilus TaxID=218144 RepID=UPI00288DA3DB|nr:HAMP domain-containing sensor histidine kinase [Vagococcus carniphilus]MDT2813967.1 HAMP domain-containing sensor histidine kinase [Vagococcus carniphilus]MDT2864006.1 HAMP domain-containing sensor histidine kinase [Vagococcus carniphilus]
MTKKRTAQYQLTKQFLLIFLGVLLVMNLLYVVAASRFVYEFVENKAKSIVSTLKREQNQETDWEKMIDTFVSKKDDDALIVETNEGNLFFSNESKEVFHELEERRSFKLLKNIVLSDDELYYVIEEKTNDFSFKLAVNAEMATELVSGMIFISLILNLMAVIFGSVLIYFSMRRWSNKLSVMSQEIAQIDLMKQAELTIPDNPIEISNVATAFNQLLKEQKKAIEREKQFITNASHDIRTPLAAIRGHVQLIKRRGESHPEVIPNSIDFIDKESKRLETLSNQLLTLEREDLTTPKEMINLSELLLYEIEKVQLLTTFEFITEVKNDVFYFGRKGEFQQIFQNLIENAIKYSPGETEIKIALEETTSTIIFTVSDYGLGISDKEKKRVFERFYRVDNSRTSQTEGSGIGLSIVEKIVSSYRGTIDIKNNEPKGTIFKVNLSKM